MIRRESDASWKNIPVRHDALNNSGMSFSYIRNFIFNGLLFVKYSVLSFNNSLGFICLIWIRVSKLPPDLEDFVHAGIGSNFRSSFNKLPTYPGSSAYLSKNS